MTKIIVFGQGKASRATATSLVEDLYETQHDATLYVEKDSTAGSYIAEWAEDLAIRYAQVEDVIPFTKEMGEGDIAIFAWSDEDKRGVKAAYLATQVKAYAYDLTMGLADIVFDGDDDEDEDIEKADMAVTPTFPEVNEVAAEDDWIVGPWDSGDDAEWMKSLRKQIGRIFDRAMNDVMAQVQSALDEREAEIKKRAAK